MQAVVNLQNYCMNKPYIHYTCGQSVTLIRGFQIATRTALLIGNAATMP